MSEAVAVPPGLLILTRTALTASSSAAFFSSSFTRASSVTSGLPVRRDGSSSAMIPAGPLDDDLPEGADGPRQLDGDAAGQEQGRAQEEQPPHGALSIAGRSQGRKPPVLSVGPVQEARGPKRGL